MSQRTALLLAYHYPPLGGVAVMRVLRFSRYLGEHGWRPIVVCVDGGAHHEPRDPALLDEVPPEVQVERVPCFEPDNYSDSWDIPRQKVIRNLFKLFDKALFPDDRAFWVSPLVRRARVLAQEHRADLIWATAQPWSTLVAGMKLKKATGLPLVLDFRDDWTTSNADFRKTRRLPQEQELEQEVLASADAVVSVTPHIVEQLRERRPPAIPSSRFFYIPNGFDPAHFPPRSEPPTAEPFTIVHAGGLYEKRPITPLLDLLSRWFEQHPERAEQVKVVLVGRATPEVQAEIEASPHAPRIDCRGFVSHTRVRELMMAATLNLLMIEQVKTAAWLFTGKVFEYIGARRPILMLGPDPSPLAELLRETGLGHVYDYQAWDDAVTSLEQVAARPEVTLTPGQEQAVARYNAREQAGQLAEIFSEVNSGCLT